MRVKLKVWNDHQQTWKVAYVLNEKLAANISLLRIYGIKFRVCSN